MEIVAPTREKSCCFTGHRPSKLPWGEDENAPGCLDLKKRIWDTAGALYTSGITHFICGMAMGCDIYFCEAIIELRAEHPEVTLEAAIPWEGQANSWDDSWRDRYKRLVVDCDFQTVVQSHYSAECMMRRNSYMVDSASVLISAYDGKPGGTMRTMLYAMRQGLEIIELPLS